MYTRASRSDYDDWEETYENPGWGSKDLIPLLKKVSLDASPELPYTRTDVIVFADRDLPGGRRCS